MSIVIMKLFYVLNQFTVNNDWLASHQGLKKGESFLEMLWPPSTLAMLQLKRAGEREEEFSWI